MERTLKASPMKVVALSLVMVMLMLLFIVTIGSTLQRFGISNIKSQLTAGAIWGLIFSWIAIKHNPIK